MAIVVLLILLAVGANYWQRLLLESMRTYRSFLTDTVLLPDHPLPLPGSRVVLVVMGGLGFDAMQTFDLPTLERLREAGASALMQSRPPSYAQPSWLTLISGVQPIISNGVQFDTAPEHIEPTAINTIFHNAHQGGLETALAGPIAWRSLVPVNLLTKSVFTPLENDQGDQQIIDNLRTLVEDAALDFILIYLSQIDYAGTELGGSESEAYEKATQQVDLHLNIILDMLDLERTTLIITADHGHIDRGGYGGQDAAVLRLPFIMFGKDIIPGAYSPVEQIDVAPTISTLLGLSLPAINQGRPLFEMIEISDEKRAEIMIALAQQRILLTETFVSFLEAPLPDLSEINKAQGFLANDNFNGAAQLAELLINQADQTIEQLQAARLVKERMPRLILSIGLIVALLSFMLWQRTELWSLALFAALFAIVTYHGLYLLEKLPYSFSAITSLDRVRAATLQRMILSLSVGGLFYIVLLALQQSDKITVILLSGYELVLFATLGFLAPALYGFWQYGLTITWFFPDMAPLFLHFTGLIQGGYTVVFGIFMPLIIMPINFLLQNWIAAYQRRQIVKLQTRSTEF